MCYGCGRLRKDGVHGVEAGRGQEACVVDPTSVADADRDRMGQPAVRAFALLVMHAMRCSAAEVDLHGFTCRLVGLEELELAVLESTHAGHDAAGEHLDAVAALVQWTSSLFSRGSVIDVPHFQA